MSVMMIHFFFNIPDFPLQFSDNHSELIEIKDHKIMVEVV